MKVISDHINLETSGNTQVIDITDKINKLVKKSEIVQGIVLVSCIGSTGAITTIEYEPALVKDLQSFLDEIISANKKYLHNDTWSDANGHSHLRSSLIGPSLSLPVSENALELGTWQQVIFLDFDNRPRSRKIAFKIIGV